MPPLAESPSNLHALACIHVHDIVTHAIQHTPERPALIVSDGNSDLASILTEAYRQCLPDAEALRFDRIPATQILEAIALLPPGALVVLIQSTNFRLGEFRIRVELFKRGLKVIEHPHLARMQAAEYAAYIDALAYDPAYYRVLGAELKRRIDSASGAIIHSGGERLVYASSFEPAKLNVGDYSNLPNVGGQFPIGEVFTEPLDLEQVQGRVRIFVFGDVDFCVNVPDSPICLEIARGRVVNVFDSTPAFDRVIAQISAEEEVWVRELGFGMNRALTPQRRVSDIGTYERMCGIHLSLGAKHGVFAKPQLKRKHSRFHVDVFAVTDTVTLNDEVVFRDGHWCV
jgi:aminopeptidase